MAKSQLLYAGGLKSVSIGEFDQWIESKIKENAGGGDVSLAAGYKSVPWLFRAVSLRANTMSQLAFHVMDGEDEIASSEDWENRDERLEWLEDPEGVLWLIEASRTLTGQCYFGKLHNRYYDSLGTPSELKYFVPPTITAKLDDQQGLLGFERRIGTKPPQLWKVEDMLYFWHPDPRVEIGPPTAWPAQAALAASGVLLNLDLFVTQFFAHGAIKATLLTAPKGTNKDSRDRLKAWWNNVFSGIKGAWQTEVVEADAITPVVIGEGVKELENQNLTSEKREDIAAALDIPQTILFSGSASGIGGGGVSEADDLRFATQFIVPASRWIARTLNKQLFADMELQLKFMTESLKVFQEDETQRSASAMNLANVLSTLKDPDERKAVFMILGYDIPKDAKLLLFKDPPPPPPQLTIVPNAPRQLGSGNMPPGDGNAPPDQNAAKALEREQFKSWARKRIKAGKALDGFVFNALDAGEQVTLKGEIDDRGNGSQNIGDDIRTGIDSTGRGTKGGGIEVDQANLGTGRPVEVIGHGAQPSDTGTPFQEYRIAIAGIQGGTLAAGAGGVE